MLLAFLGVVAVSLLVGFLLDNWITGLIIGIPLGLLAATLILSRRAERAAFAQIENQPGASGAALGTLKRGWITEDQPVAVNPRTQDAVFRAIGRPGVVLVSEGPTHRVQAAGRCRAQAAGPHPAQRHHPRDRDRPRRGPGAHQPGRQEDEQAEERTDQASRSAPCPSASPRWAPRLPIPKGIDPVQGPPGPQGRPRTLGPACFSQTRTPRWPASQAGSRGVFFARASQPPQPATDRHAIDARDDRNRRNP